ncbi:MAG: serine/threonine-protein kinase [Rudaea sp.]
MDTQRWQRVAEVFDAVADAPSADRTALLARLCGDDAALRREVESLIAADIDADGFDRRTDSARGAAALSWADAQESDAGARIGSWRVLRELGRGGMGVVYLVERDDPQFEQRAALKLIKRGMDSDVVLTRFLRERRILARLQHPHIAHLIDGGIAADGRPYFVMEYVEGEPLLSYCAQHGADLDARILLFLDVCAAVQFAHAQLVVHRDIKPGNILVTAEGSAKLLDFGIAKLLDDSAPDGAATVTAAQRPLTPAYAAPEQLQGDPVSTATDVYALGVVLYELLAGRRPSASTEALSPGAAQRMTINHPPAPSKVGDAQAPVPPRLLRGDLDTILLTALQPEPQRRYPSVEAFADDLRRFRAGRPISARRDRTLYRVRKFVARHRIGVAATALGVAALFAALALALWQAAETTRQAQASAEVTHFLIDLFQGADPMHARGATLTAQDLLDQGAQRLNTDSAVAPLARARLLHTIAATYASLGLYDRALPLAEDAYELRRANLAPDDPDIAQSMDELGLLYMNKADYAAAEPMLRGALSLRRARLPPGDPAVIASLGDVGTLLQKRGNFAGADRYYRDALAASRRRFGADATPTARRLDEYALNLDQLGKRAAGIAALRQALAIREKNLAPDDPDIATSLDNLGTHLEEDDRYQEALPLVERAVRIRKRVFGEQHPLVASAEIDLASVYGDVSRFESARRMAGQALAVLRKTLPADHPKISEAINLLAIFDYAQRDFGAAVPLLREVVARDEKTLGPDHPDSLAAKNNLASTLLHLGQYAEAERLQREVLAHARADNGQGTLVVDNQNLAATLALQGKTAEAVTRSRHALALQRAHYGEASLMVAVAIRSLASMEERNGEKVAAEKDYRAAMAMGLAADSKGEHGAWPWSVPLADFLVGSRHCAQALPLLKDAQAEMARQRAADPIQPLQVRLLIGHCESAGGQVAGAAMQRQARAALQAIPGIDADLNPTASRLLRRTRQSDGGELPPRNRQ